VKRVLVLIIGVPALLMWGAFGYAATGYDDLSVLEPIAISIVEDEMSTMKDWSKPKTHLDKKLVALIKKWEPAVRFAVFNNDAHCSFTVKNNYQCYVYATPIHYRAHVPSADEKVNITLRINAKKKVTSMLVTRSSADEVMLRAQILHKEKASQDVLFQYGRIDVQDPVVQASPDVLPGMDVGGVGVNPGNPPVPMSPGEMPGGGKISEIHQEEGR